MQKIYFALLALLTLAGINLHAQTNQVTFTFDHKAGSETLALDTTIFTIWNGKNVVISRAEFYVSEIELTKTNGSRIPLTDVHLLVNANTPNRIYDAGNWDVDGISSLTLHLGVDPDHNHLDPTAYPENHPLAIQDPSMHWGWSAGYRFLVVEGKVDNNNDGIPETEFQFHNLGDDLYVSATLNGVATAQNGVLNIPLSLNYIQLFEKLSMTGNLIQHGSDPINKAIMASAATQGFLALLQSSKTQDILEEQSQRISVTPNPFRGQTTLNYELESTHAVSAIVFNSTGQVVRLYEQLPANGHLIFAGDNLPAGRYQCAFFSAGELLARKQLIIAK